MTSPTVPATATPHPSVPKPSTPEGGLPVAVSAADGEPPRPARGGRLPALDVLRGIAILGTLATNIGIFLAASNVEPSTLDTVVGAAIGLVTDGKFIGLLTIMFGIGMEIQRQAAVRRGENFLSGYPWRAALLVIDGLLNYIFIFEFDVLMGYGLTALVVSVVLVTSPKVQAWVLGFGLVAHIAHLAWLSRGVFENNVPSPLDALPLDATPEQVRQAAIAAGMTAQEAAQLAAAQLDPTTLNPSTDSYWAMVGERVTNFWAGRGEIPVMFLMGLGLFLVGAMLYRNGLFLEHGDRLRKRVMLLSFGIGLPVDWITRLFFADYTGTFNRYFTSTLVSFGLLALVAHFYARGRQPGRVAKAVSNVGKMALTCYLAQNLIASILFYDWGFGLAKHLQLGVWDHVLAWLAVSAMLLVFSALWLRRFERGPVEWVWNRSYLAVRRAASRVAALRAAGRHPETALTA